MTNSNDLDDDKLKQVTGGMSCANAISLAKFHASFATVLGALGDSVGSGINTGKAMGLLQGACPK